MRKIKRAALPVLATAAVLSTLLSPGAGAAPDPLPGFTPEHSSEHRQLERTFRSAIAPEQARGLSTALSSHPQLVGTPGALRSAEYSVAKLRSWGLNARLDSYGVYASQPRNIAVSMTAPQRRELAVKERRYPGQRHYEDLVDGYNAYSPAGDVTGDVVYANYGLPEDYRKLEELGVDVRDKIVLVRYGESFRGVKSKVAEEHGAKGVIIYSDPADDGFTKGPVYPDGPWRPADSIQRGSIQYIFNYPGDPLTPGRPSVPGVDRDDPAQAANLPRIPTTPISYGEARHLLRALGGAQVPQGWQGGLRFPYHVGAGPARARLNLDIDYRQTPVRNVLAEIPGTKHPEQKVVIGAHYDAWTYGTNDNTSGWVSTLQIGYGLAQLMKTGWRPDRTIVLAGWDGEEYGLLGSTEYAERSRRALTRGAVAYLNMDGTAGKRFSAGSVPALDDTITSVTREVPDPDHGTVYRNWAANSDGRAVPERLGSGSDYTTFLDHLGIASAGVGFSTPGGEYHSTIDDLDMVSRFLDPGFVHQSLAAQVTEMTGLRLAEADVLPLRYSAYAAAVREYLGAIAERGLNTDRATHAAQRWQRAAERLESTRDELTASGSSEGYSRVSRAVLAQERALLTERGLPGRDWYKHQVYAPGEYTGYAVQELPGINAALDDGDDATAKRYLNSLTTSLNRAAAAARAGAKGEG